MSIMVVLTVVMNQKAKEFLLGTPLYQPLVACVETSALDLVQLGANRDIILFGRGDAGEVLPITCKELGASCCPVRPFSDHRRTHTLSLTL